MGGFFVISGYATWVEHGEIDGSRRENGENMKCIMFVLDFGLVSGGANLTGLKGEGFGKMMG